MERGNVSDPRWQMWRSMGLLSSNSMRTRVGRERYGVATTPIGAAGLGYDS